MPTLGSTSADRFTVGKTDTILRPRVPKTGKPVVVYDHSAAGNSTEVLGQVHPAMGEKLAAIASAGWTVVAPSQPLGFGNGAAAATGGTTCQGVTTDAIAYHQANLGGTDDPVVLIGCSMGSTTVLRRAGLAPSQVACVVTFLTVADLTVAYINNYGTTAALIASAYSFTPSDPRVAGDLPSNTCPTHQITKPSTPMLLTHGSTDLYSTTSGHVLETEWAASANKTFVSVPGAGHDNAAVAGVDTEQVVEFIRTHTT